MERVLHQVELTALPGNSWEASFASLLQARVVVRDDHLNAMQPSIDQAVQECHTAVAKRDFELQAVWSELVDLCRYEPTADRIRSVNPTEDTP